MSCKTTYLHDYVRNSGYWAGGTVGGIIKVKVKIKIKIKIKAPKLSGNMCYSVAYLEKKQSRLIERYKNMLPPEWNGPIHPKNKLDQLPEYFFLSAFVHPELPIVTGKGIRMMGWGLIPFWVKDEDKASKIRKGTLNAVGETVFEKPSYRSIIRSKRGLLPVSGFFEWRDYGGKKYPYFIKVKGQTLFSLGCIFDSWVNKESGEIVNSFSVVTCPANPLMEVIHNRKKRMPLILPQSDEKEWVAPNLPNTRIKELISSFDGQQMEAHTVSRFLNNVRSRRNIPQALETVNYPELPELI